MPDPEKSAVMAQFGRTALFLCADQKKWKTPGGHAAGGFGVRREGGEDLKILISERQADWLR